ncbi:MAG: hypothetical protein K8W52_35380 [Deltaproteobacteria bacterium]|nr:hypothetical protein [Deltaproteobacteria bacterium]
MIIKRYLCALFIATAALGGRAAVAQPDPKGEAAAPTPEQLEQAKKAYGEGKRLFDAKKFADAVDKFKESYRLSRNPLLLYNVGFTLDQKGDRDLAIFYYKKFLSDAPADAAQRAEVTPRLKVLEAAKAADATKPTGDGAAPTGDGTKPTGDGTKPTGDGTKPTGDGTKPTGDGDGSKPTGDGTKPTGDGDGAKPTGDGDGAKPTGDGRKPHGKPHAGPYTPADFQHQVIDSAPPKRPLDLTAFSPEDSGWQVTLYFRSAGDAKFVSAPMRPRYNELVARIPARRMVGASVQYYIEVRDRDGGVVTRIGRASSPNLVYIEDGAKPRFYPDLDDGDSTGDTGTDILPDDKHGDQPGGGGGGFLDVGSKKFNYAKWGTTGTALGMLGLSLTFYLVASSASSGLEGDASRSQSNCGTPPCSTFDADLKSTEARGQGFETMSNVTFFVGLAAAGTAGYLWYREVRSHKHATDKNASRSAEPTFVATPVVGSDFVGGAAAVRF